MNFPKQNSYTKIAKCGNNLLILENWKEKIIFHKKNL